MADDVQGSRRHQLLGVLFGVGRAGGPPGSPAADLGCGDPVPGLGADRVGVGQARADPVGADAGRPSPLPR